MTKKVKEAKHLLDKYGIKAVKPTQLVKSSEQLNKSLIETLQLIAFLKSGGQGQGPFPHTLKALKGVYA